MSNGDHRPEAKLSDTFNRASYRAWQDAVDRGEIEMDDDDGADRVEARRVAQWKPVKRRAIGAEPTTPVRYEATNQRASETAQRADRRPARLCGRLEVRHVGGFD